VIPTGREAAELFPDLFLPAMREKVRGGKKKEGGNLPGRKRKEEETETGPAFPLLTAHLSLV